MDTTTLEAFQDELVKIAISEGWVNKHLDSFKKRYGTGGSETMSDARMKRLKATDNALNQRASKATTDHFGSIADHLSGSLKNMNRSKDLAGELKRDAAVSRAGKRSVNLSNIQNARAEVKVEQTKKNISKLQADYDAAKAAAKEPLKSAVSKLSPRVKKGLVGAAIAAPLALGAYALHRRKKHPEDYKTHS